MFKFSKQYHHKLYNAFFKYRPKIKNIDEIADF